MPKQKSHSGAKDRFRVTKTGKVVHRRQNRNHILEKKSSARKRNLRREGELTGGDRSRIMRLVRR